jgi:exopolysaccharide biosynthesis polyprenyl glycosylphosphotransferase
LVYAVLVLAVLAARGFYAFRLESTPIDDFARIAAATSIAAMMIIALRLVFGAGDDIAQHTARLWAFATVFLGAGRAGLAWDTRRARRRGEGGLNTLVIGAGHVGRLVAERLAERPELGLKPIGFLDKEPMPGNAPRNDEASPIPVLGASWDLENVIREFDVEQVVLAFSTAPHEVQLSLIRRCRALGVDVVVVPRLFEEVNGRIAVEHLGGVPFLRTGVVDPKGWHFSVKYAFDRVVAVVAILAVAPLLLLLALAVRLTSPGPILYRQRRVGLDGHEFDILKFRSMLSVPGAVSHDAAWAARERGLAVVASAEVPDRRTSIGRFLRRTSLDELPQLFNVLKGDMSFVGPRPERVSYVEAFQDRVYRYGDRHRVKSGVTGWAQVQGLRGQTSLSDRVEWDNYYIENWSLWLDLKILCLTIPAVIGWNGAGTDVSPPKAKSTSQA